VEQVPIEKEVLILKPDSVLNKS